MKKKESSIFRYFLEEHIRILLKIGEKPGVKIFLQNISNFSRKPGKRKKNFLSNLSIKKKTFHFENHVLFRFGVSL